MSRSKTKQLAKAKADKALSQYVRLRDADSTGIATCCTCGVRHHWSEIDAGHFITRNRLATRYEEANVNAQCYACNRFLGGRQYEHGQYIDAVHGSGTADKLLEQSKQNPKYKHDDYEDFATKFRSAAAKVRAEKGL